MKKIVKPKWKSFGVFLKNERRKKHVSRKKLAAVVGKTVPTIASWEQGYRRPKDKSMQIISRYLGTRIQELQTLAGHTPEFDWYLSLTEKPKKQDILLSANRPEKEELRHYLHYLRFKNKVTTVGIR